MLKLYGPDESSRDTIIEVNTNYPLSVGIAAVWGSHSEIAFLTTEEVRGLVDQLQDWLMREAKAEEGSHKNDR